MNKFKLIKPLAFTILMCFFYLENVAQVYISRQVISSYGASYTGTDSYLSDTSGQPEYISGNSNNSYLSQGFQQSDSNQPLEINLTIIQADCSNNKTSNVSLASYSGCANNDNFLYTINGNPVTLPLDNLSPGDYVLQVYSFQGCTANVEFTINPAPVNCDLLIPNVFSPNADFINNIWFIQNITLPEYSKNEVKIFSRWGQIVWEGKNYDNSSNFFAGYDTKGQELPSGTYFYTITIDGKVLDGYIEIIR
jgi:gliding motility-associated-like protein